MSGSTSAMADKIRSTDDDKMLGVIRVLLGVVFLSSGTMKFVVPMLRNAWSGQLIQAKIPFYKLNFWVVPVMEIAAGLLLIFGLFSRLAALLAEAMMVVATYVHLRVDDPALFPLQPKRPVIPLITLAMAAYVLRRGGGAWSVDRARAPK